MHLNIKVSKYLLIGLFFTSIWFSCSSDSEKTISNDQFSDILGELMIIEAMNISDTLKIIMIKDYLSEQNISVNEIQIHIEIKKNDSEYWQNIYEKLINNMKETKE
jgi:hypothetical protein